MWDGLVPDSLDPGARRAFGDFHGRARVALGVSGYELGECGDSDHTRSWSSPELSRSPPSADGEQMRALFGLRHQDAVQAVRG